MRSNKDRKLNLGTAFRLTIMNQFVKKNLDVKIHKLCKLANTEETQCNTSNNQWTERIRQLIKGQKNADNNVCSVFFPKRGAEINAIVLLF